MHQLLVRGIKKKKFSYPFIIISIHSVLYRDKAQAPTIPQYGLSRLNIYALKKITYIQKYVHTYRTNNECFQNTNR